MKKRIFALTLMLCMLLASCGTSETPKNTDTTNGGTDTTDNVDDAVTPNIPEDLRFEGKAYRVLATPDANLGPVIDGDYKLEEHADVLGQAQYNRLIKTEDRFGIDIELNYGVEKEIADTARASISSGDYDFDLVADVATWHLSPIYEGLYLPISELPYIDLDKPWWNKNYIESVSVNPDNPCILFGSINLKSIERSCCTFVNTDLLEERKGISAAELYDIVLAGDWTLDKMIELNKDMYYDDNGNTIQDAEDINGLIHDSYWSSYLYFSVGLEYTGRDENNYPTLNLNNERTIALCDKLIELYHSPDSFNSKGQDDSIATFASGKALFYINRFFICGWEDMRETEVNYAIIPNAKFDETIDNYYGDVANNTQWHMVPITHPDPEFTSAVTEYFAYLGYEEVIPAYYDITLKFKYTRGDVDAASQMLDIITENQRSDFMNVNTLGGMENVIGNVVRSGQNTFVSKYAECEAIAKAKLAEYIEALG